MLVLVLPIQSSLAPLTYHLPCQSLLNKTNNKLLMAFKMVVLYPSFGERVLVHLDSVRGCQLPHSDGKNNQSLFNYVRTYNLNFCMAEIYYYTNYCNASV